MPYWDNDPNENLFMEVTKRSNIGDDILAPEARNGGGTAYNLAKMIKVGDTIIHYDSGRQAIILVSRVVGNPEPTQYEWLSANAGEKAGWNEGIHVALGPSTAVTPPVTLDQIKMEKASIFGIRKGIEEKAGKGAPLFFPWIDYSGALRTALPYLAKFPRAVLDLFPPLRVAIDGLP